MNRRCSSGSLPFWALLRNGHIAGGFDELGKLGIGDLRASIKKGLTVIMRMGRASRSAGEGATAVEIPAGDADHPWRDTLDGDLRRVWCGRLKPCSKEGDGEERKEEDGLGFHDGLYWINRGEPPPYMHSLWQGGFYLLV